MENGNGTAGLPRAFGRLGNRGIRGLSVVCFWRALRVRANATALVLPRAVPLGDHLLALFSAEPIWSVYTPSLPGYWGGYEKDVPIALSYPFANPTLFLAVCVLVSVGAGKRWLSGTELIFAVGLLAIPYLALGFNCYMLCQGRYVSVVFPAYLVMGRLLARMPVTLSVGVLGLSALYLTIFTAMFAADYYVI